jgi:Clostripain family
MRKQFAILAACLAGSVVACGGSDDPAGTGGIGGATGSNNGDATWTIFVYGHADHSLSNSLVTDMAEMTRAKLNEDVRVVLLADWDASAQDTANNAQFRTGVEWYQVLGNDKAPRLLSNEPEKNLDDPAELTGAIKKAFTDFPAERYGLILWDHGGAWDHGYGGDTQDGTGEPEGMAVPSLATAIQAGLSGAGLTGQRPLEFLSFDTCLMQTAEVAFAMRDFAKVYIANAEIDYGDGWNYEDTFTFLSQNTGVDALEFAKKENEYWNAQHVKAGMDDKLLRAHAAIDTTKLDAVASSSAALADAFAFTSDAALPVARAAYFALPAYSATFADGQNLPTYRDQGMLMQALQAGDALGTEAGAVYDALQGAIVASSLGDMRQGQLGIQLGMPPADQIDAGWLDNYAAKAKAWNDVGRWSEILGGVASAADSAGPVIEHELENGDCPDAQNLPTVVFRTDDSDVAMVQFNLVKRHSEDPSKLVMLGVVTAGIVQPGETYEMAWSGQIGMVGSGDQGQPASVFPWMMQSKDVNSDSMLPPILAVPGVVEVSAQSTEAFLLFMDGDATASTVIIREGEQSVAFEMDQFVADMPGVTFAPMISVIDPNDPEGSGTMVGTSFELPASGGVPVGGASAPVGEYQLLTIATDVWGNRSTVTDNVTIQTAF